ncbi:serine/threonine protein kinase [Nocardia otitidiscaviarum]|uniref:non-specific serine/threonine protein kinase n=1 Tax=Nocardia otitidiscaviarum TaxID=1823 RepID=A0A516NTM2_9NOCA|nr:serine/threonine-protein kinase [Nocardia otitidiscaviarum]MCP9621577.1 serine/threonine protein kinase [Nocardia otitidiscaviarum]QDP82243.1 serine/threonine protein kinase [Nocardia otitidiscaviarum]
MSRVAELTDSEGHTWVYDTGKMLGQGGAGQVFEGLGEDGTAVAVKVVDIGNGKDALRIHSREIEIGRSVAAAPDARHLLVNLGVAIIERTVVIIMPRAETTLERHLEQHGSGLGLDEALSISADITAGLSELAGIGIVHRDIKPGNILRIDGRWVLADFSISRDLADSTATWTRKGEGSTPYMSPEYMLSGIATVRSDLYALGVVLYEMLSGKRPFDSYGDTLRQAVLQNPPPPLPSTVNSALERVVLRLLAKDPAHRYSDARAVEEALDRVRTPLTQWQNRLASAAGGIARARANEVAERERATAAQAAAEDLCTSAILDLHDSMKAMTAAAATVLGDEIQMTVHQLNSIQSWKVRFGDYLLEVTVESRSHFHMQPGFPLVVGSVIAGPRVAKTDSVPMSQRAHSNLFFTPAPHGQGKWVQRIWVAPIAHFNAADPTDNNLWAEIGGEERDLQGLLYHDLPLTPERLWAPFVDLLEKAGRW